MKYNEKEKNVRPEILAYAEVAEKLASERTREYDQSGIRVRIFSPMDSRRLADIAQAFTYSNTIDALEEVKRYEEIVDYFWINAAKRLRHNSTNQRYFKELKQRLSELKVLQGTKDLCSMLIKRMSACNLDHLNPK